MNDEQPQVLKTTLKKSWVTKMVVFVVALFGLGLWGYYDATVIYPKRGEKFSEFALRDYLEASRLNMSLFRASVADPAAEYERLAGMEATQMTDVEQRLAVWLESLTRIHNLDELTAQNAAAASTEDTVTVFADPTKKHADLEAALANASVPKPLSSYDIPVQWLICFAGFAGGLWVLFLLLKAKAQSFSYKPETHELTLANGKSFTPDQIQIVDKRKWDKFFVFLTVDGFKDEIKLDLLKFVPLEEWILEMEKLSPNYEPEEEAPAEGDEAAPAEAEANADEEAAASA